MDGYLNDGISIENTEELYRLEYSKIGESPIFESVRVSKKDFSLFELYRKYKKEQLTHIMKCHDAVQFPYLYNDILFFIYFLKCAVWFFNRTRFIILK